MKKAKGGTNLTYRLVETLGQSIVSGEFSAERKFPTESELSQIYGASHSITREAVKMLTAKGLLRARPRQGTSVEPESQWNLFDPDVLRWHLDRKFSLRLLLHFTEMRLAVEPAAAALAARNADEDGISEIREGLERMKTAERGGDDTVAADVAFHVAILKATGNPFYRHLDEMVNTALRISIRFTNMIKGREADIGAHEAVYRAIAARDADRASGLMQDIIRDVVGLIRQGMEGKLGADSGWLSGLSKEPK
ncbi:MAG TPA: FCD domain-containing protein [Magnetospirillaceae bacterium]|nr:FCD domain-containing protein [Magnetospirillaceae bacterium]